MIKRILSTIVLLVATVGSAHATLIRVELDGSGDYINIQDAVNVAASGDTLMIGPGRWDQMFTYSIPAGGWTDQVIVAVDYKDLTLIGAGQGVTIIGPEVPPPFGNPGPVSVVMGTDHHLDVQDMTIENMRMGLYFWGRSLHVKNVFFLDCKTGIAPWATHGSIIETCEFQGCFEGSLSAGSRADGMTIKDCTFTGTSLQHIDLQHCENILISGCDFYWGSSSFQFSGQNSFGTVRDCRFHSGFGPHISVASQSQMTLERCRLFGGNKQLMATNYSIVSGEDNEFLGTDVEGGGYATIHASLSELNLHNSHILKGNAEYTLMFEYYGQDTVIEHHLENNYWGTTSLDSINTWIWDENDQPSLNMHTIIEPFFDYPIPNDKKSLGGLKQLFR